MIETGSTLSSETHHDVCGMARVTESQYRLDGSQCQQRPAPPQTVSEALMVPWIGFAMHMHGDMFNHDSHAIGVILAIPGPADSCGNNHK